MKTEPGSPSWRQLALLALAVLIVHTLALRAAPGSFGHQMDPGAGATAFLTRTIEPAGLPVPVAPPPVPLAKQTPPSPVAETVPENLPAPLIPAPLAEPAPAISEPESSQASEFATPTVQELAIPPVSPTFASSTATLPAGPASTLATAVQLPESVVLAYKVTGSSRNLKYYADAELGWKRTMTDYDAYMKISAMFLGSRTMTSVGSVTEAGLAPTRFADKFRSEQAAHFDADKKKITFSANTPDVPWVDGVQDRVSVFMQLAGMLAARSGGFASGSEITLYTVGPRDADTWTFTVETEEKLQLPAGEFATIKLSRKPRREYDQKVEVWYAPSLGYLPVRNRITQQNGDFVDQNLSEILKPL